MLTDKIINIVTVALSKDISEINKREARALQRYYNFVSDIKWNKCNCNTKDWQEIYTLVSNLKEKKHLDMNDN